ncbi:Carnitine transport permease protein OpuCB [Sporomusa ovata DSM 2662]|uniref:Osmotically activated L-carnitine/choline ABC transporter, permease protein OpuCB n=1 Tax=Sporomusa ovata TaxID=2378 RepID=A0A0U1KX51_9FIRM|nr:ABC transporter permease [Sporomusa ovata]EQB28358.1 choline transport system permease protein OpuBB [Sporomusa ovata DSM 2662]CQR71997.1 Osmotically activated L-carnitine/choline ABC transporter, permease protein OpuCB [Sporomusa ovata]
MEYLSYLSEQFPRIKDASIEHLVMTAVVVTAAIVVAVPLGIYLTRRREWVAIVFGIVNGIQTIPSLALLGFMIPIFGLGYLPAVVALFCYALLPILRNTVAGIEGVDKGIKEAAQGMGMNERQILLRVELPLAMSAIMAGIRTSTIIIVGWATLAAYIGGGGLGRLIMAGMAMGREQLILAGAFPAACIALALDAILGWLEGRMAVPGRK